MPLPTHCIKCNAPFAGKARAVISISVMGDEYIYSYYHCASCAHYTVESYHNRFLGEDEVSFLPPVDKELGDYAVSLIEACPTPGDKNCECPSHRALYHGLPSRPS